MQLSIVDGRRLEQEGSREDILDSCKLLLNKQGQPLLAHGRSGSYSDDKHIVVPMIVSFHLFVPVTTLRIA